MQMSLAKSGNSFISLEQSSTWLLTQSAIRDQPTWWIGAVPKVVTTIPHPNALKCFVTRADDITFDGPNGRITFPARREDAVRTSRVQEWAVENLRPLQMPTVRTVVGSHAAIEAIIESAQGGASFENIVVKHDAAE